MKNPSNNKLWILLFFSGAIMLSCVHDDDFSVPEIKVEEPNITVNTDIVSVKQMYRGYEPKRIETGDGSNNEMYLEAFVISSDESGNIYKQLFIQDAPENPTAGVVISTEATDLYTKFEPGRKIYFRVDGLYIGQYAGLPSIGIQDGDEVGRINREDFEERIFRSTEKAELVPTLIPIAESQDPGILSTLVQFENVQFPDGLAGVEHYGNLTNTYGVNRIVENCDDETIILRTSGFSDFKNLRLPEGNGTLTAVLSIFGNDVQLLIRDTDDVNMTGERCATIPEGAVELPFFQNFEGQAAGQGVEVSIDGWTNVNINNGDRLWEVREFNYNKYAQTSAYNSGESPYEVWLVTPGLILPVDSNPTLTFDSNDGHYNGDGLMVKVSTDFDGDVSTATWTDMNPIISSGHTTGFGENFTPSGEIDLSEHAGQVIYIAYRYLGASNGISTTYQIDNISVEE